MFAITSSRVVTPSGEIPAAVLIEGEKIVDVVDRSEVSDHCDVKDFGDLLISPGIVDAHAHINEPGRTDWEGFSTATSAGASGGITSIIDMPLNSSPVTTNVDALKAKWSAAAGKCFVDVGFYGGLVPNNADSIKSLGQNGVHGIKAFMCDSGLEEYPASRESDIRAAMKVMNSFDMPLLAHAELLGPVSEITNERSFAQFVASRPPEFEIAAIELLIKLCRESQTPVHIVHLATASALPLIINARADGLPVTVETCPHYLFFSSEHIDDGRTEFKCTPPIRDQANRDALRAAVASGLIDTIGSDHSPCPPELKLPGSGDFTRAWGGIAGLQLTLPVCWTVGRECGWTTELLARILSENPAEITGLGNRKGKIQKGFDADFVIWNPDEEFVVVGEELLHRHSVTPYNGEQLSGVVVETILRGEVVFSNGAVKEEPTGTILIRDERDSGLIAEHLNLLVAYDGDEPVQYAVANELRKCCASSKWVARMLEVDVFQSDAQVMSRAEKAWSGLEEEDYLEAFSAHPRIGDINTLREKFANTKQIASGEQSGVASADDAVLKRLAEANDEYFEKFGFIFIVCATGKSAAEMLEILERRLKKNRATEIDNAAAEQLKITRIRLRKLIA